MEPVSKRFAVTENVFNSPIAEKDIAMVMTDEPISGVERADLVVENPQDRREMGLQRIAVAHAQVAVAVAGFPPHRLDVARGFEQASEHSIAIGGRQFRERLFSADRDRRIVVQRRHARALGKAMI
jgi:hypothetical protein